MAAGAAGYLVLEYARFRLEGAHPPLVRSGLVGQHSLSNLPSVTLMIVIGLTGLTLVFLAVDYRSTLETSPSVTFRAHVQTADSGGRRGEIVIHSSDGSLVAGRVLCLLSRRGDCRDCSHRRRRRGARRRRVGQSLPAESMN